MALREPSQLPRRRETLDAKLFLAINGLPRTAYWDQQVELLSDLGKGIGWVAAAGALALDDGRRGRRAAAASTLAMFAAIGLVQGPLKAVFPRRRPFASRLAWVVGTEPVDSSFPSGHTAGSFAAATALAAFYPRRRVLLLGTAAGVGFSRVYLGHHFVSDVLVGAAVGIGLGRLAAGLFGARPGQPLDRLAGGEAAQASGRAGRDSPAAERPPARGRRPNRR